MREGTGPQLQPPCPSLAMTDHPPVFTEYSPTLATVQNTEVIKDLVLPFKELSKY